MTKKKYRKNYRFYILIIIVIILACYLLFNGFYYLTSSKEERALKKLNYSTEAIELIVENKIDKYLINNNIYSKTLEMALIEGLYDEELLEEYVYFTYKDYDNYIVQLNKLNELGYERDDIKTVFDTLNENDIDIITNKDHVISNLVDYIENDYFQIANLDRYENYKNKHSKYDADKVVSYVNMYLDYPYYEHTINVEKPDDPLVIVNKYYKFSSNFVPKNLVNVDKDDSYNNYTFQISSIVKEKFDDINKDMAKAGLGLLVKSGYRSYDTQVGLYNDYVAAHGKAEADTFSARAGYSEHQTGLAIDVCARSNCSYGKFESTNEYDWMIANAHKYGFILRYPKDKTDITGYDFESWHYRYVGVEVATYIHEHNLTFDEYYSMFIANKKD